RLAVQQRPSNLHSQYPPCPLFGLHGRQRNWSNDQQPRCFVSCWPSQYCSKHWRKRVRKSFWGSALCQCRLLSRLYRQNYWPVKRVSYRTFKQYV
ncbi:hypothetical protein IW150_006816, partial [Coemansia sp. RSA 2607]